MSLDPFAANQPGLDSPATRFVAITPADADIAETDTPRAIYVGVAGSIVATGLTGTAATFQNVAAGTVLPIRVRRIAAASTASGIIGLI